MPRESDLSDPAKSLKRNQAMLREEDYDRYLVTTFLPQEQQPGHVALYALNVEIAKTRSIVSEPALGEIRLAWWREAVTDMIAGNVRNHDILQELAKADLDEQSLHMLIAAREADIYNRPMANLEELIAHAVNTSGQLEGIAASMQGGNEEQQVNARKVGAAWALVGLMRALPHHLNQPFEKRWNYLPQDRVAELGLMNPLSEDADQRDSLCLIVDQVCDIAGHLLDEAAQGARSTSSTLLATLCRSYLRIFRKAGYDPFNANFDRGALGRFLRLWWAK